MPVPPETSSGSSGDLQCHATTSVTCAMAAMEALRVVVAVHVAVALMSLDAGGCRVRRRGARVPLISTIGLPVLTPLTSATSQFDKGPRPNCRLCAAAGGSATFARSSRREQYRSDYRTIYCILPWLRRRLNSGRRPSWRGPRSSASRSTTGGRLDIGLGHCRAGRNVVADLIAREIPLCVHGYLPQFPGRAVKISIAATMTPTRFAGKGLGVSDGGQGAALPGSITIFMRFQISFIASTISVSGRSAMSLTWFSRNARSRSFSGTFQPVGDGVSGVVGDDMSGAAAARCRRPVRARRHR